jgi:phosphoribosyl 1,2-cyclic phosphodiesterase
MPESILFQQVNKDHAYWSEKRKVQSTRGGHTAGLLTHKRDGVVLTNILFDAGLGTIDGLNDLSDFSWEWPLQVFITHGHIDHHAELMILSELWCKREANPRQPLLVRCTEKTFDCIQPVHSYGFAGGNTLAFVRLIPGTAEKPSPPIEVGIFRIFALSVDHFPPGSVIYVVEAAGHKIIVGWDMKTLLNPDDYPVLKNPSLALLEANTWSPLSQRTGHTSVEELVDNGQFQFIRALDPARPDPALDRHGIYLVHYGGGEDPNGAMPDARLADRFQSTYPDLAPFVKVAERGQSWSFKL